MQSDSDAVKLFPLRNKLELLARDRAGPEYSDKVNNDCDDDCEAGRDRISVEQHEE